MPFIVDTLGRLHDDARRTLWHLAGRQIARNYQRRGWQAGRRHLHDYQRDKFGAIYLLIMSVESDRALCLLIMCVRTETDPGLRYYY